MAATLIERAAPPKIPARVQAARVFVLARLLTALTAIISGLTVVAVRWLEMTFDTDYPLDQDLLNWRIWPLVFCFWYAVFAFGRRYLRLDTRP